MTKFVVIGGSTNYDAADLCNDTTTATVSDSGNIVYRGNPTLTNNINGIGNISRLR